MSCPQQVACQLFYAAIMVVDLARHMLEKSLGKRKKSLVFLGSPCYLINMKNEQQEKELMEAIGIRALYVRRFGSGYAIKWFAKWQEEHNKKWGIQ